MTQEIKIPNYSANNNEAGVIWLTGLPAAGKTTIAKALATQLRSLGHKVEELDGDNLREIFPATGFSRADRDQHLRRAGYLASRLEAHGIFVVASFISPFEDSRLFVRNLCKNYFEVFVSTPIEICEQRDPKGLYRKARAGLIQKFTGVDDPYEVPTQAELVVETLKLSPQEAANKITNSFFKR